MATFRQRGGRWQALIRRSDLKATKTFAKLADARKWATAKERDADLGDVQAKKVEATTLRPLIEKYEREMWPIKKWGDTKTSTLNLLARDLDKPLPWFKKAAILRYVRTQLDAGLAPSTVVTRLSYLRDVFATAEALWDVATPLPELDRALAAGRKLKMLGGSRERDRRPTDEELKKLLAWEPAALNAHIDLAAIVRVLAVLPIRLGELCGIEWADLVPARRAAIIRARKHPDIRVKERNDEEVPLIKFGGVDTYELISTRPKFMERPFPYRVNSVSAAFGQACLKLKIDDLRLHDLRTHATSCLLEAEVPIPQVAKITGHRKWDVLAKHYAKIKAGRVHSAIEASETRGPTRH